MLKEDRATQGTRGQTTGKRTQLTEASDSTVELLYFFYTFFLKDISVTEHRRGTSRLTAFEDLQFYNKEEENAIFESRVKNKKINRRDI